MVLLAADCGAVTLTISQGSPQLFKQVVETKLLSVCICTLLFKLLQQLHIASIRVTSLPWASEAKVSMSTYTQIDSNIDCLWIVNTLRYGDEL